MARSSVLLRCCGMRVGFDDVDALMSTYVERDSSWPGERFGEQTDAFVEVVMLKRDSYGKRFMDVWVSLSRKASIRLSPDRGHVFAICHNIQLHNYPAPPSLTAGILPHLRSSRVYSLLVGCCPTSAHLNSTPNLSRSSSLICSCIAFASSVVSVFSRLR